MTVVLVRRSLGFCSSSFGYSSPVRLWRQPRGSVRLRRKASSLSARDDNAATTATTTAEPKQGRSTGTLTARIIPRAHLDYTNTKPFSRRAPDESFWINLVKQNTRNVSFDNQGVQESFGSKATKDDNNDNDDRVVVLDIDIKTTVLDRGQLLPIQVELHMQRQVDESANRTLRRMELSTQRKILHGYRYGYGRRGFPDRESSIASSDDPTSCFMIRRRSSEDGSESSSSSVELDDQDQLDGYSPFDINTGVTIGELLFKLRDRSGTLLHLDGLVNESPGISLQFKSLPPTILTVQTFEDFGASVFVGIPLVVESTILHAERPLTIWFVGDRQVAFDCVSYIPTMDDVGKTVSVVLAPIFKGEPILECAEVYQFENVVEERPALPIVDSRSTWLPRQSVNGSTLRIMSYNLLADEYASREIDQQAMYNHCRREDIARTRRMPLLIYEMLAHQPDILCLQEVDEVIFKRLIYPVLSAWGYNGYYSTKASAQLEGCAMFWNLKVFHQEALQEQFPIRDLLSINSKENVSWGSMSNIFDLLNQKPDLKRVVTEKVGQVFQIATLRLKDGKEKAEKLVVGNTHLFYHPMADHIRAMQTYMICMKIDHARRAGNDEDSSPAPFILCGDLNSDPLSGTVRLLLNRKLEPYHFETWKNLDFYSWEQGEEEFLLEHGFIGNDVGDEPVYINEAFRDAPHNACLKPESLQLSVEPPFIELPPSFPELELGYETIPEFTNYAVDFAETLDYIFASKASTPAGEVGFELVSSASIPGKDEMAGHVAMPNKHMPSDHVSIACDLKWVKK